MAGAHAAGIPSKVLGRLVIADNKAAAACAIGMAQAANAAPDGYTLVWQ